MVIKIVSYTYIFMQKLSFLEYPQTLIFVFFCLIYLTFIPVVSYSTNMLLGDIDYTLSRTTLPETLLYGERGLKKMDRKKGELQKCCSDGTKWLTEAAVSFWQPTLPTTTTGWLCSQQSGSGQVTNNTQYTQWTYFFFFQTAFSNIIPEQVLNLTTSHYIYCYHPSSLSLLSRWQLQCVI